MSILRVGLVGLGVMGKHHARALSCLPGVSLVGVCDTYADETSVGCAVTRNLDHLVDLGLDYCVVSVPTSAHAAVGLSLASNGIPTLIEKPIAGNMQSADALRRAFVDSQIVAGVGHIERFNPAVQEARRRIKDGQLGSVIQISTVRQGPFPGRLNDVGVALDLATHDIDLTAWIGSSNYSSVSAQTRRLADHVHEDLLVAVGTLDSGIVTNHVINWLSPRKERSVTIIGERGVLQVDTLSSDLTFFENGTIPNEWGQVAQFRGISQGDVTQFAFPKREPLMLEHEAFRDAVLGLDSSTVTLDEAVMTLRVALAALDSAQLDGACRLIDQGDGKR